MISPPLPPASPPSADKSRIRKRLLQQRSLAAERYRKNKDAQQKLLALFQDFLEGFLKRRSPSPLPCSGYLPIRDEIDPRPLMALLRTRHAARILLPVVENEDAPLVFRTFDGDEKNLQTGAFATKHPPKSAQAETPVLLLVPLLAFDARCVRLGYGGGFYDRTLADLSANRTNEGLQPFALGIAFDAQRCDALPREAHDKPLDAVLSETRLYSRD